jgi:hypothetical protein
MPKNQHADSEPERTRAESQGAARTGRDELVRRFVSPSQGVGGKRERTEDFFAALQRVERRMEEKEK